MADPSSPPADGPDASEGYSDADADAAPAPESDPAAAPDRDDAETGEADDADVEALRRDVDEKYDFENFGPADMAEMSADEWEAAFDPDSWITGAALLDRVEADLRRRIAAREVFAVLERIRDEDADADRIVAYSDEGYAIVYPDGSVEGEGTVLRDVKPTVALCSMDDYDVGEAPEDASLPRPEEVVQGSGELGNVMLQVVGATQVVAGLGLLVAWLFTDLSTIFAPVIGGVFVLAGLFFFVVVANARLSDRFRAEAFRDRLRAAGVEEGDPPEYLPVDDRRRPPEEGDGADRETGSEGV